MSEQTLVVPKTLRPFLPAAAVVVGAGLLLLSLYPDWIGLGSEGFGWRRILGCQIGCILIAAGLAIGIWLPDQAQPVTGTTGKTLIWRRLLIAFWLVLAAILTVQAVRGVLIPFWSQVLDDAFITFRYSRNLINGFGLRWNPTDAAPLEGFTSLTHVLLGALFLKLGWEPVLATRVASLLAVLGITGLLAWQARRSQVWPIGFLIPAALLAGNPYIFFAATNGMDTLFAALAITAGTVVFCVVADDLRYVPAFCLASLACVLTRPDSLLFVGGLWFFLAIQYRLRRQFWIWVVCGLLLPLLAYAGLKKLYFGDVLPTSFYFKSRLGQVTLQLPLVTAFLVRYILPAALVTVGAWVGRQARLVHVWIVLVSAAAVTYFITVRPAVAIGYRFMIPFYPAVLVALVWPAGRLGQMLTASERTPFHKALAACGLAILAFAMLPSPRQFSADVASVSSPDLAMDKAIGRAYSGLPNPQAIVLATGESGAIPFYTDMFQVDPYGLVTKDSRNNPFSPDMVFERNPDIFVTHSVAAQAGPDGRVTIDPVAIEWYLQNPDVSTPKFSYAIISDPRFASYELVAKLRNGNLPENIGYHYIFVRRDSPYAAELKTRAQQLQVALASQ